MVRSDQAIYRTRVISLPDGIELQIPARRSAVLATLLVLWLCGWTWGMIQPSDWLSPIDSPGISPFVWCAWTLGEIVGLAMLLWTLTGREHICVVGQALTIRRMVCGLSFDTSYDVRTIKALRVVEDCDEKGLSNFGSVIALFSGPLAFDSGAKTVLFGAGIETVEANYVLSSIVAAKPTLDVSRNPSS